MAYQAILDGEVGVGRPILASFGKKVKDNFDYLYDKIGSAGTGGAIPNGSFEVDSDKDGYPDNWNWNAYSSGALELVTVDGGAGRCTVKITHPGGSGNGGGTLESDYLPCAAGDIRSFSLLHWAQEGLHNRISVHFFDDTQKPLSNGYEQVLFDTVYSPPTPDRLILPFVPPTGAHFFKVLLYGGMPDEAQAGEVYFDDVCLGDVSQTIVPMWGDVTRRIERMKDNPQMLHSLNPYLPGGRFSIGSGERYLIMAPGVVPQDWAFVALNRGTNPRTPEEIWYAPLHPCLFNGDNPATIRMPWRPENPNDYFDLCALTPQQIYQVKQKQKKNRERSFGDILWECRFSGQKKEGVRNVLINGRMTSVTYDYFTVMSLP